MWGSNQEFQSEYPCYDEGLCHQLGHRLSIENSPTHDCSRLRRDEMQLQSQILELRRVSQKIEKKLWNVRCFISKTNLDLHFLCSLLWVFYMDLRWWIYWLLINPWLLWPNINSISVEILEVLEFYHEN